MCWQYKEGNKNYYILYLCRWDVAVSKDLGRLTVLATNSRQYDYSAFLPKLRPRLRYHRE